MDVNGLLISKVDLFRFPIFPIIGSIITTLLFFFDVGIIYYSYIFEGAVLLRYYSFLSTPTFVIVYLPLGTSVVRVFSLVLAFYDLPVFVEMAELFELTEDMEEFKSTTLLYKFVLFLNNWARFILKIVSVGRVGLES